MALKLTYTLSLEATDSFRTPRTAPERRANQQMATRRNPQIPGRRDRAPKGGEYDDDNDRLLSYRQSDLLGCLAHLRRPGRLQPRILQVACLYGIGWMLQEGINMKRLVAGMTDVKGFGRSTTAKTASLLGGALSRASSPTRPDTTLSSS